MSSSSSFVPLWSPISTRSDESMELDSPVSNAGRNLIAWDELSEKTHQNKLSIFWKSFVIPLLKETQQKIVEKGSTKGIPVELLLFAVELTTKTHEKRKGKFYFPESRETKDEEAEIPNTWKLCKSIAYVCNSFQISSRARDAMLTASKSQIKGYEVKEMLRAIDNGMNVILPIHQPDNGVDFAFISPLILIESIIKRTGYKKPEIEIVFSGDGRVV
jgi:hypothetical protein